MPADIEKAIVNPDDGNALAIVLIKALKDKGYDSEFVKRILDADESAKDGNLTRIKDTKNIWADIL